MLITANIATMPSRAASLPRAIGSLAPQVDRLRVYLNSFDQPPACLRLYDNVEYIQGEDLGATGKFYWANQPNEVYFTVDDDFVYPPNYVRDSLAALMRYGNRAVITLHGSSVMLPCEDYVTDRRVYRCMDALDADQRVLIGGTGVMCFRTDMVQVALEDFRYGNASDIEFSAFCFNRKIPIICRAHEAGVRAEANEVVVPTSGGGGLSYMRPGVENIYGQVTRPHSRLIAQLVNALFCGEKLPEGSSVPADLKPLQLAHACQEITR